MAELPADWAARARAARAYANVSSQKKFGDLLGISEGTIKSYENGGTPDRRAIPETLRLYSEHSGLPTWFFTAPDLDSVVAAEPDETSARLRAIEEELKQQSFAANTHAMAAEQQLRGVAEAIARLQPPQQQ